MKVLELLQWIFWLPLALFSGVMALGALLGAAFRSGLAVPGVLAAVLCLSVGLVAGRMVVNGLERHRLMRLVSPICVCEKPLLGHWPHRSACPDCGSRNRSHRLTFAAGVYDKTAWRSLLGEQLLIGVLSVLALVAAGTLVGGVWPLA